MRKTILKSKGVFAQNKIVYLVLAMIIGVILVYFTGQWNFFVDDTTVTERCKASVERNARYNIAGLELGSEIDCPTKHIIISGSEEEAKEKIANAMYTCWKQFGRGKLRLFSEEGIFCNICYTIDLKTDSSVTNFTHYLLTTPSPTENMFYYDYLSSFQSSKAEKALSDVDRESLSKLNKESLLETDTKYAVIFFYAKGEHWLDKATEILQKEAIAGGAAVASAGIVIGATVASGVVGKVVLVALSGAAASASTGIGVPIAIGIVVGTAIGVGVYIGVKSILDFLETDDTEWAAFTILREWNAEELEKLECTELV